MTTATALLIPLLWVGICAADNGSEPLFSCNLRAISTLQRPRYNELLKRIRTAIRDRNEIAHGYTFRLDSQVVTLPEAAEWIVMERRCCPFLTIQLSASGNQADWVLTLIGPPGAKPIIAVEFPVH